MGRQCRAGVGKGEGEGLDMVHFGLIDFSIYFSSTSYAIRSVCIYCTQDGGLVSHSLRRGCIRDAGSCGAEFAIR